MKLQTLAGADVPAGCGDVEIVGITADSRQVRPGWLFAAMPGSKADGARFVPEALSKGAAAILAGIGADIAAPEGVPVIRAAEPRRALALMAARFYGAQPETILAVTGTSGKTSVADFTRQILAALGHKAASLGTIGLVKPDGGVYGALTTPDPVTLHATLAELAREGITHLAFEASSHGLDQHRLDGVRIKAAAFTNLGRDHLDYHPTLDAYFAAKLRLFSELLPPDGIAVVNADAERAGEVIAAAADARPRRHDGRPGRRCPEARGARPRRLRPAPARAARRRRDGRAPAAARRLPGRRTRCLRRASPSPPARRPAACCRRWQA